MKKILSYLLFPMLLFLFLHSCSSNEEHHPTDLKSRATNAVDSVYTFPDIYQILESQTVYLAMEAAWGQMRMQAASGNGRREYGFYIYYRHNTGEFYVGPTLDGTIVYGCAGTSASIHLGPVTNNLEVCAFFHCHTTLANCPDGSSRSTGPSLSDYNYAKSYNLPGIVYDYEASSISMPGHSSGDKHRAYTFGPTFRPEIYY